MPLSVCDALQYRLEYNLFPFEETRVRCNLILLKADEIAKVGHSPILQMDTSSFCMQREKLLTFVVQSPQTFSVL